MLTPKEVAEGWKEVIRIYEDTIGQNSPAVTMNQIVNFLGFEKTEEIFATIAKIKIHDGRIYGFNRDYMNSIPVNPECLIWDCTNPVCGAGLDEIHTAHIDNMITQLRKLKKERSK